MSIRAFAIHLTVATMSIAGATHAFAATELQWWHAMAGANNEVVEQLAKEFNESQKDYKIVPVFKGSYPETLQAGIAEALRNGQADGTVRTDIEPELMAAGLEAVVIALLMSLLQVGNRVDSIHARGSLAVLEAAIRPPTP